LGRDGPPPLAWQIEGSAAQYEFDLGVDVNFVGFRAAPNLERAIRKVEIQPVRIVDRHRRPVTGEVLAVFHRPAGTLYFHDRNAWVEPEGFWTRGGTIAQVTVAPGTGKTLPLRIRCGPRPNTLTLATGGWQSVEQIPAGAEKRVALPYAPGHHPMRTMLTTESGFTPATVEPQNRDRRFLGCRIEIES
jgi:hypothetical protein